MSSGSAHDGVAAKAAVGTIAAIVVALALPSAASADVLYQAPKRQICLEGAAKIRVGIWYQTYSGGPRWFKIRIRHRGERVYTKNGRATTTWRFYGLNPPAASNWWLGRYNIVVRGEGWRKLLRTRVVACGD